MILPDLPLSTRLAIQVRLAHRIVLSGPKDRQAVVGLRGHLYGPGGAPHDFGCERLKSPCRVDYHGGVGSHAADLAAHPEDFLPEGICPARYEDVALAACLWEAVAIEDLGGLSVYSGLPVASLPARVVEFYRLALAARDRFVSQREAAQAALYSR